MGISKAVVDRITELCKARNITVHHLCIISAVPYSTVNESLHNKTKSMKIVTLKKLCDGLEMSITDFFDTDVFRNLEQEIE